MRTQLSRVTLRRCNFECRDVYDFECRDVHDYACRDPYEYEFHGYPRIFPMSPFPRFPGGSEFFLYPGFLQNFRVLPIFCPMSRISELWIGLDMTPNVTLLWLQILPWFDSRCGPIFANTDTISNFAFPAFCKTELKQNCHLWSLTCMILIWS